MSLKRMPMTRARHRSHDPELQRARNLADAHQSLPIR